MTLIWLKNNIPFQNVVAIFINEGKEKLKRCLNIIVHNVPKFSYDNLFKSPVMSIGFYIETP